MHKVKCVRRHKPRWGRVQPHKWVWGACNGSQKRRTGKGRPWFSSLCLGPSAPDWQSSPSRPRLTSLAAHLSRIKVAVLVSCCGLSVLTPGSCLGPPAERLTSPSFLERAAMWLSTHPPPAGASVSASQQPAVLWKGHRVMLGSWGRWLGKGYGGVQTRCGPRALPRLLCWGISGIMLR